MQETRNKMAAALVYMVDKSPIPAFRAAESVPRRDDTHVKESKDYVSRTDSP